MEYKQIIRCGVKEETILEIGKFSILWNMLEERHFDKYMTDKKSQMLPTLFIQIEFNNIV